MKTILHPHYSLLAAALAVLTQLSTLNPRPASAQSPVADDFNPGASWNVYSLAMQPDGKILVGGEFSTLGGQPRYRIGRLNADGTLEASFNPGAGGTYYPYASALVVQTDGKILVGGSFTNLGGQARNWIGRLNPDGTLDASFNPGADGNVPSISSLAVQADGKILVGGGFTTLGGQTRNRIGRLNADGTLDASFNPGVGGASYSYVSSLAVQADGKILVGGFFTTLGGQMRTNIGRLNADGTLDASFNPGARGTDTFLPPVSSLTVQADGKILVGGDFNTLGGQARDNIGRLNADGTLDASFNPGVGGSFAHVLSLALQADGKILVGGDFTTLGGQTRTNIGRLNNTGPATQSLAYNGSAITWLRGGTSPEAWRTTFEHSPDGVTWTSLGAGVRITGGWQLTNIVLPPRGAIRARGFVTGGAHNGSAWFVESQTGAAAPMRLSLHREGPLAILGWTGNRGPYQLQQTSHLENSNSWQDVGAPLETNSISLSIGTNNVFLRVRGQ